MQYIDDDMRQATLPSTPTADQINKFRQSAQAIFAMANERIRYLTDHGIYNDAMEQLYYERGEYFFNPDVYSNPDVLRVELARARVFLNDRSTLPEQALLNEAKRKSVEADIESHMGRDWVAKTRTMYDTSYISKEQASRAYKAYRELESHYQGLIGRQGSPGTYGSDTLINAIMSYEVLGESNGDWQANYNYGLELIKAFQENNNDLYDPIIQQLETNSYFTGEVDDFLTGGFSF